MDHHHVELSTLGVFHHLRELRALADVVHARRAPLFDVLAQARPTMNLREGTEGPDLGVEAVAVDLLLGAHPCVECCPHGASLFSRPPLGTPLMRRTAHLMKYVKV